MLGPYPRVEKTSESSPKRGAGVEGPKPDDPSSLTRLRSKVKNQRSWFLEIRRRNAYA
jgi:hypothetical protein